MKALQQIGYGDPKDALRLVDVPDPEPGPSDIVLKMLAVPVHGLEVRDARDPRRVPKTDLPKTPGLEGCGRVVAVGSDVTEFAVGDLALPPPRCGTYRQYISAPAADCYPAPPDADSQQLALVLINGMTSALLFQAHNTLSPGEWMIHNAANSSCGRWLIALANEAGLKSVNLLRREAVAASLYEIGADVCLVDTGDDHPDILATRVKAATKDADMRLGFDTIAGEASGRMAHCLSIDAKLIVYGDLSGQPCSFIFRDLSRKGIHVSGYRKSTFEKKLTPQNKRGIYAHLNDLIATDKLKIPIAGAYTFEDYAEAFAHAARGGTDRDGKIILLPNG
ncbi:MAG: zinc-dependent alcohol dehydrogenase family protein [Rhodospirillaceae bacterium]